MSYFVVSRDAGPSWIDGTGAFEQPAVEDHGAYMNALAATCRSDQARDFGPGR
jgi:hypothetical protein